MHHKWLIYFVCERDAVRRQFTGQSGDGCGPGCVLICAIAPHLVSPHPEELIGVVEIAHVVDGGRRGLVVGRTQVPI
jgi:hypothetical protein